MKTYRIKYQEGDTINKVADVEGKTMAGALMMFLEEHPAADYESIEVVHDDGNMETD